MLYRVEPKPGGVRIFDGDEQVAMLEVPPGVNLRRWLDEAGWPIVRAGSGYSNRVLVRRREPRNRQGVLMRLPPH